MTSMSPDTQLFILYLIFALFGVALWQAECAAQRRTKRWYQAWKRAFSAVDKDIARAADFYAKRRAAR